VLEVLYHHTMPNLVRLEFHPPPGRPKMSSFLFVSLSITLLNNGVSAYDFAKKLEYKNSFDNVGYGKVCSCTCFLRTPPYGDITKCRKPKAVNFGGFLPPVGDRIYRLRRNLCCVPCVYPSTPNLALIGKGVGTGVPRMTEFAQNCAFWPPVAWACQRRPYVYCLTPNLAWISKAAFLQEPLKM